MKKLFSAFMFSVLFFGAINFTPDRAFAESEYPNKGTLTSGSPQIETFASPDDSHTYSINTIQDGKITITLEGIKGRVRAYLTDIDNRSYTSFDSYNAETGYITDALSIKQGNYLLTLVPYDWGNSRSSGQYSLKATYVSTPSSLDSNFEPNDIPENGFYLINGKSINSSFSSNVDQDWYSITTLDYGEIYFQFFNLKARMRANLYDENFNSIGSYDSYNADRQSASASVKAGTYYLKMSPYDWGNQITSSNYSLSTTFASTKPVHDSKFEPNDTFNNAYPINSGVSYKGTSTSKTDLDWYSIKTHDDGDVNITLEESKGRQRFYLYNENGENLQSYDTYGTENTRVELSLKKGTYYIQVSPYDWETKRDSGSYILTATYSTETKSYNSQFEPNSSFENGFPIIPSRSYSSTLSNNVDIDWFKLTSNKDGMIKFKLSNLSGRVRVGLYDSLKNNLGEFDSYGATTLNIEREAKSGTYYVRILPYDWEGKRTSGSYTFVSYYASNPIVPVAINGKTTGHTAQLINNNYYLPAQDILKSFGATVTLKGKIATIKKGTQTFTITSDSTSAILNGKKITLSAPFKISNGKLLAPSIFFSKNLALKVTWSINNTLNINK